MANNVKNLTKCSIPGCNTISGQNKNIQFHKIKKYVKESNKEKKKWLEALPFLSNEDFSKSNYVICSLHFTDDDYICRSIRNFGKAWGLKSNAIPTMNLPNSNLQKRKRRKRKTKLQLQTDVDKITDFDDCVFDIEYMGDSEIVEAPECECKSVTTANVGTQCNIIGSFGYNYVEEFINENLESFENYMERRKRTENISSNTKYEDELLREINDVEFIDHRKSNEPTCDLPSDDVFFNEISNKNNQQKLSKTKFHCCEECGLMFTDFRSYRDHEGVHAEISLLCYFCGEYSEDYIKHIEHEYRCQKLKKMENDETIPVKKRKKIINNMDIYNDHRNKSIVTLEENNYDLNTSTKVKESFVAYSCGVCDQFFKNENNLTEHYNTHSSSKEYTEDLKEINEESYSSNEYKLSGDTTIEFLNYAKNQLDDFVCKICEKSYATEYLLNRHIDVKHLNPIQKNQTFQCKECAMTFRNLQKFQSHIREHAVTLKYCKICNLTHNDNTKYLKHLRNKQHLTLEGNWKNRYNITLFACSLCKTEETKYNKLADLADHSNYHRISKTRTFINSSLTEHEINSLKS